MKKYISFFFIVNYSLLSAQVGGLSASKLGTYCTETVPEKMIEFEPAFSLSSSTNMFDNNGELQNLFSNSDSIQLSSSLDFRFSYGLFKNFEVGLSLPVDISTLNIGVKYKLPIKKELSLAIFAGYNAIVGNEVYIKKHAVTEATPSIAGGIIASYNFSDKFGFDFNTQYHKHSLPSLNIYNQGFTTSLDIGYYFFENVNFICGFIYSFENNKNNYSQKFTINTGIAIEKAEKFILVLNSPIDLFGKNEYKTTGFGMALTIILN